MANNRLYSLTLKVCVVAFLLAIGAALFISARASAVPLVVPSPDCSLGSQFDRCANESYYTAAPLSNAFYWIWPTGNNQINSARGTGPNDMRGFINVITRDLDITSPTGFATIQYINSLGFVCTLPPTIPGDPTSGCLAAAGQMLGASYIVNTMMGIGGDNPIFGGMVQPPNIPWAPADDAHPNNAANLTAVQTNFNTRRMVNGINVARAILPQWASTVDYYESINAIDWTLDIDYCFDASSCGNLDATKGPIVLVPGPKRIDQVLYKQGLDVGSYVNDIGDNYSTYMRFRNPGPDNTRGTADDTFFVINKHCGNITGPASPLVQEHDFQIEPNPSATLTAKPDGVPAEEDPAGVNFGVSPEIVNPPINNVTITREYYIDRYSGPNTTLLATESCVVNFPLPSVKPACLGTRFVDLTSFGLTAGDQVCTRVTANPGTGKADASGNLIGGTGAPVVRPACQPIENRPYIKAFGGDIFTGVSSPCSGWPATVSGNGGIYGMGRTHRRGAGNQLGLLAFGKIAGFRSAVLRDEASPNPPAHPPTGLHFANDDPSFLWDAPGGLLEGTEHCINDYYSGASTATPEPGVIFPITPHATGSYVMNDPGVKAVPWTTGNVPIGRRITLYISGDVVINDNITYSNGAWINNGNKNNIPSFTLVASGNIYIGSNVTRLDGSYIAQGPNSTIYTCTTGATPYTGDQIYDSCRNQLTVNGSLIATRLKFLRAFGSLRNSDANEQPFGGGSGGGCANAGGGIQSSPGVCGSEVINFGAETYLAPVPTGSLNSATSDYDYFTTLPPLL